MIRFDHFFLLGRRVCDFGLWPSVGNFAATQNDKGAPRLKGRLCGAQHALACANQFTVVPAVNGSMGLDPDRTHVSDLRVSYYLRPSSLCRSSDGLPTGNKVEVWLVNAAAWCWLVVRVESRPQTAGTCGPVDFRLA